MRTLLATAILLVTMVGSASASEVSLQPDAKGGKFLRYTAAVGELNSVSIMLQGTDYTLQDMAGPPMTIQAPCTQWALERGLGAGAMCPATDVNRIEVDLGDQTDFVSLPGILVPATIRGGSAPDRVFAGDGPDTIDVFDGSADNVTCNAGDDTVYADPSDTVAPDCEHVVRHGPLPFTARVGVGASTVRYGCSDRCTVAGKLLLRGHKMGTVGPVALGNGGAARVPFKLSRAAKRALASRGRLRLVLSTTFTTDSGLMQLESPVVLVA